MPQDAVPQPWTPPSAPETADAPSARVQAPSSELDCPDPATRAPRARGPVSPTAWLQPAPAGLQGALVAVIGRDIRACGLTVAQRLTHFPASPLMSLSWFWGAPVGRVAPSAPTRGWWRPFDAPAMLAGSLSMPTVYWSPGEGHGLTLCFTADVARALLDLVPADLHDRLLPAQQALAPALWPMLDEIHRLGRGGLEPQALRAALERHLAPRWQERAGPGGPVPTLKRIGRHWVDTLAWQAHAWRGLRSARQIERRIKAASGRSLRDWQALVRTEGLFFAARERHEAGRPFDWAELAQEQGFADQAHLIRAARRITGFTPGEFAQRFLEDESFWLYRLWV